MLNDDAMYNYVIHLLKTALPSYCHYHNYEHTLYVWHKVAEIGAHENCTPEEVSILKAAALWHDTGFLNNYEHHEEESCSLATAWLLANNFSQTYADEVCGMIMATKLPQLPKSKLEEIVADADLEYLGTEYAALIAANLFIEFKEINPSFTKKQWNDVQISFLQNHHYFTSYCIEHKTPLKEAYLHQLLKDS